MSPTTSTCPTALRESIAQLEARSNRMRRDVIRMVHAAACGHPAGPLGMAEMMSVLYFHEMAVDPTQPAHPMRDRFILSNGHCCAALYSTLARRGFFPAKDLAQFRKFGSHFQGHPHLGALPGIEMSTGSLGTGVSVAGGMALAAKVDGSPARIYAVTSDGESQEGQPWENATAAAHYGLGNLTLLLDWNGIQIDGRTEDVMNPGDIGAKYAAFGWQVIEVDGHEIQGLIDALAEARADESRPTLLACRTTIGKGVSYMEDIPDFHGMAPNDEQAIQALRELGDVSPEDLNHEKPAHWTE
ncbi:MAG: transketolase [Planctomycetes bacterium]|nr:transketolase [Planctomycetota bacterium]